MKNCCRILEKAAVVVFGGLCLTAPGAPTACAGGDADSWPVLRTYEGEYLRRVKMPIGGIGTGTISLSGRGALVDWQLCNRPDIGHNPNFHQAASGFWLRAKDGQGKVSARILEGPIDTELYEGGDGSPAPSHGFPRFRNCRFKVAYPLAQVELKDDLVPVAATLEAMNPLVPGDAAASGIPAALLRWRLTNLTDGPLEVSVMGFLVSPVGYDIVRTVVATNGLTGVQIASPQAKDVRDRGEVAFVVPASAGEVSQATHIDNVGWMMKQDCHWKQFCATGRAADYHDAAAKGVGHAVAASVTVTIPPHSARTVPFVLCWRYPNRKDWKQEEIVGNHYATLFATPADAAATLLNNLGRLEGATVDFVRSVCNARSPEVVREAALFNLSTLRTETCFRTADGHFFGWEGVHDKAGSCYGNCTHVWGYEHALVDLWPELAKDVAEMQFGVQSDERGHMSFRVGLPLAKNARECALAAADGQMQCVIKAFEIWKKTKDDAWMRRLYPRIRQAVAYAWVPGGWDADRDGVMEGCQHNTMDVEYYGPNPQMEFLYLAALKALAAMSDGVGERAFAGECRELIRRGQAWTEANLFNGTYYEHKITPPTGEVDKGTTSGSSPNPQEPDYQLGAGCLVDQLLGDYAARAVGLGPVADARHSNAALDAILRLNASTNFLGAYNCGRDFALPDEPALKMAWYPEGRMPKKPFPYYGENMTGFEYVTAANLAQRGRWKDAERVVRDIRSRYDGRKRNPFDEAECGHHYARAMVAWTVLRTWQTSDGVKVSAFGYDPVDSTEIIQRAIDSGTPKLIFDRQRGPWIARPLVCRSNIEIVFEDGVELVAKRGEYHGIRDYLFRCECVSNIVIRGLGEKGGTFRMWKSDYLDPKQKYAVSEWRYALRLCGVENVLVENMSFRSSGGDGIVIGSMKGMSSRNVTVRRCVCDDNHRQGISLCAGENILIEDTVLSNTKGTAPEAGIDFEPDMAREKMANIVLRNVVSTNNAGTGFDIYLGQMRDTSKPASIRFENCKSFGNRYGTSVCASNRDGHGVVKGLIEYVGCDFTGSAKEAIRIIGTPAGALDVAFRDCTIRDAKRDVCIESGGIRQGPPDGIAFDNLTICQPKARAWFEGGRQSFGPMAGAITGRVTVIAPDGKREVVKIDRDWVAKNLPEVNGGRMPLEHVAMPLGGAEAVEANPGAMTDLAPVALVFGGHYVMYVPKAGAVKFVAHQIDVTGKRPATTRKTFVRQMLAGGKTGRGWELKTPGFAGGELTFNAPAAGFYSLELPNGGTRVVLDRASVPVGIDVREKPHLVAGIKGNPFSLWFWMPGGKAASLVTSGDNYYRFAAKVTDPSGKVFSNEDLVEGLNLVSIPSDAQGLWRVDFRAAKRRTYDWVNVELSGVPGILFLTPDKYWR